VRAFIRQATKQTKPVNENLMSMFCKRNQIQKEPQRFRAFVLFVSMSTLIVFFLLHRNLAHDSPIVKVDLDVASFALYRLDPKNSRLDHASSLARDQRRRPRAQIANVRQTFNRSRFAGKPFENRVDAIGHHNRQMRSQLLNLNTFKDTLDTLINFHFLMI
jgi:hypothetical protein